MYTHLKRYQFIYCQDILFFNLQEYLMDIQKLELTVKIHNFCLGSTATC